MKTNQLYETNPKGFLLGDSKTESYVYQFRYKTVISHSLLENAGLCMIPNLIKSIISEHLQQ